MGLRGQFLKKRKFYTQNLTKERKQPPLVILGQAILYSVFILYLCLRIIGTSDQDVQFMNFPSQIFFHDINHGNRAAILKKNSLWLLPFYIVWLIISIMKRCAERCALQLYQTFLSQDHFFSWRNFFVFQEKLKPQLHNLNMTKQLISNQLTVD